MVTSALPGWNLRSPKQAQPHMGRQLERGVTQEPAGGCFSVPLATIVAANPVSGGETGHSHKHSSIRYWNIHLASGHGLPGHGHRFTSHYIASGHGHQLSGHGHRYQVHARSIDAHGHHDCEHCAWSLWSIP